MARKKKKYSYQPGLGEPTVLPLPVDFSAPNPMREKSIHNKANSAYTEAKAQRICTELMLKKSLTEICRNPRNPSMRTVTKWLADPDKAAFREMYYYARRIAAELRIDDIFEIAEDTTNDWKLVTDKKGKEVWKPDNENVQRSRLRVDTAKWYASKMIPKIYGDKIDVELDATGDLAELLKKASNQTKGLPDPVNE